VAALQTHEFDLAEDLLGQEVTAAARAGLKLDHLYLSS
jgi:hypothetical protein